jgi:CHAP domain
MSEADVIQRVRRIALEEAKKSAAGALDVGKPMGTNTNNVKYNTAFYGFAEVNPDKAWCVVFIWWVMRQAGVPATVFPKKASVFKAADGGVRAWFKARHRFMSASSMPKVGDLVIFKSSHIGIVENVQGNTIFTVEGNASDRVRRRSYSRGNSNIDGYCHPAYEPVEEADMTPEQARQLEAIFQGLTVQGTTSPEETVNLMFDRIKKIEAALTVPGTTSAEDSFNLLFARVREIHHKVVEEQ